MDAERRELEEDEPPAEQFQSEIVCRTVRRRFTIHRGHCGDVAESLLRLDWSGRLVHDGWSVYDRSGARSTRRGASAARSGKPHRSGPSIAASFLSRPFMGVFQRGGFVPSKGKSK